MKKFEMEAPIVMETEDDIVQALREIADDIENGRTRDWIPGEVQGAEWFVGEDDDDDDYDDDYDYNEEEEEDYN